MNITTIRRVNWETVLDRTILQWEKSSMRQHFHLTEYAYIFLICNIAGSSSPNFKLRQKDIKFSKQEGFPEISVQLAQVGSCRFC